MALWWLVKVGYPYELTCKDTLVINMSLREVRSASTTKILIDGSIISIWYTNLCKCYVFDVSSIKFVLRQSSYEHRFISGFTYSFDEYFYDSSDEYVLITALIFHCVNEIFILIKYNVLLEILRYQNKLKKKKK